MKFNWDSERGWFFQSNFVVSSSDDSSTNCLSVKTGFASAAPEELVAIPIIKSVKTSWDELLKRGNSQKFNAGVSHDH